MAPYNSEDARGLMKAAIRDNNHVVEHGVLGIVVVRQREFDWGSTVC